MPLHLIVGHARLGDSRVALNLLELQRLVGPVPLALLVVVLDLHHHEGLSVNPHDEVAELDLLGFLGRILQLVILLGGLDKLVLVVVDVSSRDVLIEEVRADKARALVRGRNALEQVQARQEQPPVVILVQVLPHQKGRLVHVRRAMEEKIRLLLAAECILGRLGVLLAAGRRGRLIPPQNGKLPLALLPLPVRYRHQHSGPPVGALVVAHAVGPFDDLIDGKLCLLFGRLGGGRRDCGQCQRASRCQHYEARISSHSHSPSLSAFCTFPCAPGGGREPSLPGRPRY